MHNFILIFSLSLASVYAHAWDFSDFKQEASSPVRHEAAKILIVGSALTITTIIFEEQLDRSHDEVVDHKPLGDLSNIGDLAGQLIPNAAYVIGQSAAALGGNEKGKQRAIGMFKTTAYAASVTTALKYTIREPRPNEHKDRNSFPSGHTTTAFAFGGYVLAEHGWKWGAPAIALSTLSGISRINDNRHRIHDVLAGATIGLAYAFGITREANGTTALSRYNVMPMYDEEVKGVLLSFNY